ncbi:MAG: EAL domain-containing protein [Romboutsia sp.]|uniref:putative bifunctional diguanylate cyclase/phosphodiesterase n=1 Tax=Romboutsia sp. TaxID=1965302 RepID=UPI003F2BC1D9
MKNMKNKIVAIIEEGEKRNYYNKLSEYGYSVSYDIGICCEGVNLIIIDGSKAFKLEQLGKIKNKKIYKKTPTIGIIESEEIENLTLYMEWGMDDYIKYPCNEEEVIFRIEQIIGYKRAIKKLYKANYSIEKHKSIIKNQKHKFQNIIDTLPISIWVKDKKGFYMEANSTYYKSYNLIPTQLIGKSDKEIWHSDKYKSFLDMDNIVLNDNRCTEHEGIIELNNEEKIYKVNKFPLYDIDKNIIGLIGTSQDITDYKLREEQIIKCSMTDFLTKISNRRGLYEYLEDKFKDENNRLTVLFMDIDEFKKINDVYGHKFGDDILKIVTMKICKIFENDFVSRIGGDEFVVVLDEKNNEELEVILNKLIDEISFEIAIGKHQCFISSSIGVVNSTKDDDIESILIKADLAMYSAKEKGKNTFAFYECGMAEEVEINSSIEADLYSAIEREEVCLYYQPQFSSDRKLLGFEALFRWNNAKYKNVSVSKIISIMEQSKLIHKMGKYIFRQACIFAKEINENREERIIVSINISPVQLMRKEFILEIMSIINEIEVNPMYLGLEITEGIFLENTEESISTIARLKNLGMKIFLDDFGTRYSSLNYLVKLPISSIKIDKSFIDEIVEKGDYYTLTKLITDIAHSIKLPVVAEGVENNTQLRKLKDMNVDVIQGYIFSRPLSEEDAKMLIERESVEILSV